MTIIEDIKVEELEAVEELRKRVKESLDPEMYEDIYLFLRFLKARDFNLDNAEDMIKKHLKWREENDIKNIFKYKVPEVVNKYFTYAFLGYDKNGYVIRYVPVGKIDMIGLLNCLKAQDIKRSMIYESEMDTVKLQMHSKELGRNVDKCVYILNLEGFSFTMNNYPERLKALYVLNSSIYVSMVYTAAKGIVEKSLLDKVHFYYDDSWKAELLKEIDEGVLPAFLGGTRRDPDGNSLCLSFINHGGTVPEKYYIHKSKRSLASMEGVKKIYLSRAAFHEENFEVREPGSYLEWEFETKSRDIGFGVFYTDIINGCEHMTELIPHQRINTEEYSETGTYMCEKAGKYVFLFDNTYSWIRSKEIYYRITIVTPQEQEVQLKQE